jgi:uncharacterized protein (TIGR02271 family)
MGGPNIDAGQHMSAAQAEELSRYYGLTVPIQQGRGETAQGQMAQGQMAQGQMAQGQMAQGQMAQGQMAQGQMAQGQPSDTDWLVRQEERFQIGKETLETGRVKLHKYVDVEPIEQAIHVYHEEYDVERIPITADEQITGSIQEGEQEIILHEERAVVRKETVPVERVRLRAKRVEEDSTVRDDLRRERIEIEPDQSFGKPRN